MNVFVVEDDAELCQSYRETLAEKGWGVTCFHDGYKGANYITETFMAEELPDIAIIDLGLPNRDGQKLVQQIRGNEDEEAPVVPILVVTGSVEQSVKDRLSKYPRVTILQKPLMPSQLVEVIMSETKSR